MNLQFAVICEAPGDFSTATELAGRVLVESIDWLDPEHLDTQRSWIGSSNGYDLIWRNVKKLAYDSGIVARGHFGGEPGEPDAAAARRAILYLRNTFPKLDGVMLIRDQDDQPERRNGLEQARKDDDGTARIVIGLANVERESWIVCGFEPRDEEEQQRLTDERQILGFDPRLKSHELTACKNDRALRSPKRVLLALCGGARNRESQCWKSTELSILRLRGQDNGLTDYLSEIRERLSGLIGRVTPD